MANIESTAGASGRQPPNPIVDEGGEALTADSAVRITAERALEALAKGSLRERGLLPYSSNHSFLVVVTHNNLALPAVYKPQRGESPLWDFEWGTLCKRERSAFLISRALGWDLIPPTVLRGATRGLGSVQFYVDHEEEAHYFTVQHDARFADAFRQMALFDYITNNADRKSGHCLVGRDGRIWAIDHGLCFHAEYKLRTVIWEFAGEVIAPNLLADLASLQSQLAGESQTLAQENASAEDASEPSNNPFTTESASRARRGNRAHFLNEAAPFDQDVLAESQPASADDPSSGTLAGELCELLALDERRALSQRLRRLIRSQVYPAPDIHRRNYPWPPV